MDNFDLVNFNDEDGAKKDSTEDEPLKIDLGGSSEATANGVSRKPLSLGGAGAAAPKPASTPQPVAAPKPAAVPQPAPTGKPEPAQISYTGKGGIGSAAKSQDAIHSEGEGITGVKTFFTKLHHGSVVFMDEQITDWLKAHPDVRIKRTNVCVGDMVAKTTEPNVIVMVWY